MGFKAQAWILLSLLLLSGCADRDALRAALVSGGGASPTPSVGVPDASAPGGDTTASPQAHCVLDEASLPCALK